MSAVAACWQGPGVDDDLETFVRRSGDVIRTACAFRGLLGGGGAQAYEDGGRCVCYACLRGTSCIHGESR